MDDLSLKQRTFRPYFLPAKSVARLGGPAAEGCQVSHHDDSSPSDIRAMLLVENGLQPLMLKRQGQDFPSVATHWETVRSGILHAGGATPVVDQDFVVVGYLTFSRSAGITYFELLDVDGLPQLDWMAEDALEPSLPSELLMTFIVIGVTTAAKAGGGGLRLLLRGRLRKVPLPDVGEVIRYGPPDGFKPHFHGSVRSTGSGTVLQIDSQVTKINGLPVAEAVAKRKEALRFAAQTARARGQPTFILRVNQSNPASTDAAEELVKEVGVQGSKKVIPSTAKYPNCEWTLTTAKVLKKVGE